MIRRMLSILLWFTLFLCSIVIFVYLFFPLEKVKEYVEFQVNASGKVSLSVETLDHAGLGAWMMEGVRVGVQRKMLDSRKPTKGEAAPAKGGQDRAEVDPYTWIDIDTFRLGVSLWDLLTDPGTIQVSFDMELLGGTIEGGQLILDGELGMDRPSIQLPVIRDLALGETELFATGFSAVLPSLRADHVTGVLVSGLVDLSPGMEDDLQWYEGELELELEDIVARAPVLVNRVPDAGVVEIPLTDLRLGTCVFDVRVGRRDRMEELDQTPVKGKPGTTIRFEKGECKGESLDYFIEKNSVIMLPPSGPMAKGTLELWTRMAFSPDYFEEGREEGGKVVTKNRELGQSLEFDRLWQTSRDVDGYYWMHCQGSIGSPRCRRTLPPAEEARKATQKRVEEERKRANMSPVLIPGGRPEPAAGKGGTRDGDPTPSVYDQRRDRGRPEVPDPVATPERSGTPVFARPGGEVPGPTGLVIREGAAAEEPVPSGQGVEPSEESGNGEESWEDPVKGAVVGEEGEEGGEGGEGEGEAEQDPPEDPGEESESGSTPGEEEQNDDHDEPAEDEGY
jgi:hypothetical protein